MTWFFAVVVVALIGLAVVMASGRLGEMPSAQDDRPDVVVPADRVLTGADIAASRFGVAIRGYRVDEVDTLLERLAAEVDQRDRRLAELDPAVKTDQPAEAGTGRDPESGSDAGGRAELAASHGGETGTDSRPAPDA